MKKNKKIIIFIGLLILLIVIILFVLMNKKDNSTVNKDLCTQLYLYDLGNSSIELLKKDDYIILINTGLEEDRDNLLDYLEKQSIDKIDYLILTNKYDESIGNASFLLDNYNVSYVILNEFNYVSEKYKELDEKLKSSYAISIVLNTIDEITIDELTINVYPNEANEVKLEDSDLIVEIKEGDNLIELVNNSSIERLDESLDYSLIVSNNESLYNVKSKYYVYDGSKKITKKDNLLYRNIFVYFDSKDFNYEKA